jgi:diguanylate cyclase
MPCILVSIVIGAYMGYSFALRRHGKVISEEREKTLQALQTVLESAAELRSDVDHHNTELRTVGHEVSAISSPQDYESVKSVLLQQITEVIESNRRLEHDLVYTRYRLEEQAQELDRTRLEARTDALSGVGNRKAFDEALQFMISKMHKTKVRFALLLIDVDHFKWINDTHGHQSGDSVIQRLGETLKSVVRPGDYVARFGGDEFAVLYENVNLENAERAAWRMRNKVERTNFDAGVGESRVAVTLSMGLAVADPADAPEEVFRKADAALYRSKESGRNRLTVFNDSNGDDLLSKCPERPLNAEAVEESAPQVREKQFQ